MKAKTSKIILITGTSSGFGKDLVRDLLMKGHTVIASLRGGQDRFATIFRDETRKFKDQLHFFELHMEKPETFAGVVDFLDRECGGRLDILINNAGYGLMGPLEEMSETQVRHQMDVNFLGPVLLTQRLLPALRRSQGRIINVTSICGLVTFPLYGMYCASKHALEAYTEGLHYDLKPFGVQVSLVEPGGFKTNFATTSLVFGEASQNSPSLYRERVRKFESQRRLYSERLPSPAPVIRCISRLCEKDRIPLRNIVGIDASLLAFLSKVVPDRWRVALTDHIFRRMLQ